MKHVPPLLLVAISALTILHTHHTQPILIQMFLLMFWVILLLWKDIYQLVLLFLMEGFLLGLLLSMEVFHLDHQLSMLAILLDHQLVDLSFQD